MKIMFWKAIKVGPQWGLVLWMIGGGVIYPALCLGSLLMMTADFVIPVPSSSPPPWHLEIVGSIGRELYGLLFWPFLQSNGFYLEGQKFWILPAVLGIFIGATVRVVRRSILRGRCTSQ